VLRDWRTCPEYRGPACAERSGRRLRAGVSDLTARSDRMIQTGRRSSVRATDESGFVVSSLRPLTSLFAKRTRVLEASRSTASQANLALTQYCVSSMLLKRTDFVLRKRRRGVPSKETGNPGGPRGCSKARFQALRLPKPARQRCSSIEIEISTDFV
jgi:hypothetical protein